MYINQNSLQYKQFKDFEKYAKFICEKFDVSIQLESTRACTDGNTIYLPNVLSMTSKEVDMMYAILLHEAGHIRYSTFDEKYFLQLKTQWHAFLANSIEDARIENLLLKDFGGAADIFDKLYTDYTQDKNLMKKVFKHNGEKPDMFATLAFYIHNELVSFGTSELKDISGSRMANRIIKFVKESGIDELLVKSYPKKPNDVIALTNEVYDRFLKYFKKKDTSEVVDYKKELSEKKAIEKLLEQLKEQAEKVEAQLSEIREKVASVSHEIDNFDGINSEKIQALRQDISSLNYERENLEYKIKWKAEYDQVKKQLANLPEEISKVQAELEKQLNEKKSLEEKMASGVNGRGKEMTVEQKEALKEKIEVKKRQSERLNNKVRQKLEEQKNAQASFDAAQKEIEQNPSMCNKDLNVDAVQSEINDVISKLGKSKEDLEKLESGKRELESNKNSLLEKIKEVQGKFAEEAAEEMFKIDKMGSKANIDLDILPEINYQDAWPDAASVQEEFDSKASKASGKMVRNGQKGAGLFGTNIRDIMTFIDKRKEKVEEIDVLEIFKGRIHASKLEDLNNDMKVANYQEDKSVVGVFGTRREHIPFTTQFDSTKKEIVTKDIKGYQNVVNKNASFYRDLKRIFARNFKFSKKIFWRGAQEEGSLDVRNLWKLPTKQGDDFFEISNPKYENKVAATILVDISGSQNKEATEYGEKIRSLVIGLSQALAEVHVKHEILGFHAPVCEEMRGLNASSIYTRRSNKLETIVYKEAAQKDPMGVMNLELQMSDNSDGESLRIAIKRLKAIRAKSHMIFIISDGKPFLCDTDISVLDEDFKAALRMAVNEKVQVFGLGFFNQLELFMGDRFCNTNNNENILNFFNKIKA